MPPFHLSAVPYAPPRRVSRESARESLLQELRSTPQPAARRGPAWWRSLGPRPGTLGGGWLPR